MDLLAVLTKQDLGTEHLPSVLSPLVCLHSLLLHQQDCPELPKLGEADEEFVRVPGDQEVGVDTREESSVEDSVWRGHSLPSTLPVSRPSGTAP